MAILCFHLRELSRCGRFTELRQSLKMNRDQREGVGNDR